MAAQKLPRKTFPVGYLIASDSRTGTRIGFAIGYHIGPNNRFAECNHREASASNASAVHRGASRRVAKFPGSISSICEPVHANRIKRVNRLGPTAPVRPVKSVSRPIKARHLVISVRPRTIGGSRSALIFLRLISRAHPTRLSARHFRLVNLIQKRPRPRIEPDSARYAPRMRCRYVAAKDISCCRENGTG